MTRERFRQIRALYEAALELAPGEIQPFLERECGDDVELRRTVEGLLTTCEQIPVWFSDGAIAAAGPLSLFRSNAPIKMDGHRLGGYRIVLEIGHGGMGSVYLAERVDGLIHKRVAIKLIRPGLRQPGLIERFRRERQILASLEHPGIARFMDAGSTEDGFPYLIMDYVQGKPIDEWCDEQSLSVSERVRLMREVCAAVHYAHQNLVVHRDIKPGNILVTNEGRPKLLDFGIAKIIDQESEHTPAVTATMARAMTPEYASPEQIRGDPITTLTDVYSLGVVLYELLTGRRPYLVPTDAPYDIGRIICEQEPSRPSEAVEDGPSDPDRAKARAQCRSERNTTDLRRRLAGDLDSILLKALRKERDSRYTSVEQFSEDLRRYLDGLPVHARKGTVRYRAGKFLRRNPAALVAALLFMFVLAGVFATLWQARVALQERRDIEILLHRWKQAAATGDSDVRSALGERLLTELSNPASGRRLLIPGTVLVNFSVLVPFAIAVFASRASVLRVIGAMAGGGVLTLILLAEYQIAIAAGWWRNTLPGGPNALAAYFFPSIIWAGAMLTLVVWRTARRFGWPGMAVAILAFAGFGIVRDQAAAELTGRFVIVSGMAPLVAGFTSWLMGAALAYTTMRIVAGSARSGELTRSRPLFLFF